jgi:hypothetical protein
MNGLGHGAKVAVFIAAKNPSCGCVWLDKNDSARPPFLVTLASAKAHSEMHELSSC